MDQWTRVDVLVAEGRRVMVRLPGGRPGSAAAWRLHRHIPDGRPAHPRFVTKYGTKQGVLVLGKQIPFFIGVGIGAGGNHLFGWFVIKAAGKILGPPPELWDAPNRTTLRPGA
jgi:hypothetical protein